MKGNHEMRKDFDAFCEKYGLEDAVIGYADTNNGVGTLSKGAGSKQYEISAVLFGFYKSQYHEFIGDLLEYGKKGG